MRIALFGNSYQEKYKQELNDFVGYLQDSDELMIEKDFKAYLISIGINTEMSQSFDVE